MLRLLARSGTGQRLTTYTTLITGPRREGEQDGPDELHVVILDNGRSKLAGGRYHEMLACIRCGACLNVCPVYRKTGGAAYGPVYSGPMGAVLVPLLAGLEQAPDLPHASSLCGACTDACPVKIPLHELLLELRRDLVEQGVAPLPRAALVPALVVRVVVAGGLPPHDAPGEARRAVRRSCRARSSVERGPDAAEAGAAATGTAMSLVDEFAANAEIAGFVVHRGEPPEIDGAGVSRATYALADTGSVVLAASPDEPRAASLLPDVHVTLVAEDVILAGPRGAFRRRRRRPAQLARDRHRARAAAPTSSSCSPWACTAPARFMS